MVVNLLTLPNQIITDLKSISIRHLDSTPEVESTKVFLFTDDNNKFKASLSLGILCQPFLPWRNHGPLVSDFRELQRLKWSINFVIVSHVKAEA